MAKDELVVGESRDIVPKHDPVIPSKLADMANVGGTAGHDGLRCLTVGHIDIIAGARSDQSLKLDTVILKGFG